MKQEFDRAGEDLAEVLSIAEFSGARLIIADAHLEHTYLCLAEKNVVEARKHFNIGSQLVFEIKYKRSIERINRLAGILSLPA